MTLGFFEKFAIQLAMGLLTALSSVLKSTTVITLSFWEQFAAGAALSLLSALAPTITNADAQAAIQAVISLLSTLLSGPVQAGNLESAAIQDAIAFLSSLLAGNVS